MGARDEMKGHAREVVQNAGKKKKRVWFIRWRMWLNYLLANIQKDQGVIPKNIGDKILISNNMFVTKYFMSSIIQIEELSLETPTVLVGHLIGALRKEDCSALVDVTFKNQRYDIDLKDAGLESRTRAWGRVIENEAASKRDKTIATRCLYTKSLAEKGVPLMQSRIFLTVRAKTGTQLAQAEKIIFKYLDSIGAGYILQIGDVKHKLEYISILSDRYEGSLKDVKAVINSPQTLAQMLPNSGAMNDMKGSYLGFNILNNSQFLLDWSKITLARNVYLIAPSGVGKTLFALNLCSSACENDMAVCVQDIKGNEFTNFIKGTGGYIVSLRQNSSGYINTWKMHREDTDDMNAVSYFNQRLSFSKQQMIILSGLVDEEELTVFKELLETFHESLYISLGVLDNNRNTWNATETLTPFKVFDMLQDYITPEVQRKYGAVVTKAMNGLRMSMSRTGSNSYIFNEEFDYAEIMKAPTLMFDFGILEGATSLTDPILFKLKFMYMRKLNAEYVAYKYAHGKRVLKILEESQIAMQDLEIAKGYVEEFTLRRAQNQTTILLGNSVAALCDNGISKALIENTRALLIGTLSPEAKETVIEKFGLEEYSEALDMIGSSKDTSNSFLFINNMQKHSLAPVLKVHLEEGKEYKLFTPTAQNIGSMK